MADLDVTGDIDALVIASFISTSLDTSTASNDSELVNDCVARHVARWCIKVFNSRWVGVQNFLLFKSGRPASKGSGSVCTPADTYTGRCRFAGNLDCAALLKISLTVLASGGDPERCLVSSTLVIPKCFDGVGFELLGAGPPLGRFFCFFSPFCNCSFCDFSSASILRFSLAVKPSSSIGGLSSRAPPCGVKSRLLASVRDELEVDF